MQWLGILAGRSVTESVTESRWAKSETGHKGRFFYSLSANYFSQVIQPGNTPALHIDGEHRSEKEDDHQDYARIFISNTLMAKMIPVNIDQSRQNQEHPFH